MAGLTGADPDGTPWVNRLADVVRADVGLDGVDEWLEVVVPGALPHGPPETAHPVVLAALDAGVERVLFPGSRSVPISHSSLLPRIVMVSGRRNCAASRLAA